MAVKAGVKQHKEKVISKVLRTGLVVLFICVVVGIILVVSLRETYLKRASEQYQALHVDSGALMDSILKRYGDQAALLARQLEGASSDEEIGEILVDNAALTEFEHIYYLKNETQLYEDGTVVEISGRPMFSQMEKLDYATNGYYLGMSPAAIRLYTGEAVVVAAQVPGTERSFLFAPIHIADRFQEEIFSYQTQQGECLVISTVGDVLAHSGNSVIITENSESFQLGLLGYSDGEETSKRAVQDFNYEVSKKAAGYVTVITRDGYHMQVSYSPLLSSNHLVYVSCYKSNLVEGEVKPLIFRSELACIIITVLMVAALIYVWARAKGTNITIERLAYEDPVTGGHNLNYFREFALDTLINSRETPFVIYRYDISNFRYINESYGHRRADRVLESCIRNFERFFSEKELTVRIDADQFLAILVNDSLLEKRFDEYTAAVNADARGNAIKYPVRFKCGVYQIKKHDHDIDVMIDHANVARKTMKGDEKERRVIYSERFVDEMRKVDHIESAMQKALAENEFQVYLQPKWDIVNNKVIGAEALVRWIRKDGTVMNPDQFVPIFENNGFIEQLDFYTLESVCIRMREMMDEGIPHVPVSVNQSRLLLHSPDYVENVEKLLKQYEIPPDAIELEITESVFDTEREEMITIIHRLKHLGVRLAMDDFGEGYSSLNMLTQIPFDVIKIDGTYFARSAANEKERMVLTKIVEVVAGLGMEVVCEGVENEEQVGFLQKIGCRTVQGFYYSRPMPEPEFITRYCKNES